MRLLRDRQHSWRGRSSSCQEQRWKTQNVSAGGNSLAAVATSLWPTVLVVDRQKAPVLHTRLPLLAVYACSTLDITADRH